VRTATFGVGRGVFVAPWNGRNGERILVAVDRQNRFVEKRLIPAGEPDIRASDELWELLERLDPVPALKVI
jgi:hypothetical protein